jgi:hypothetical protein
MSRAVFEIGVTGLRDDHFVRHLFRSDRVGFSRREEPIVFVLSPRERQPRQHDQHARRFNNHLTTQRATVPQPTVTAPVLRSVKNDAVSNNE